MKITKTLLLLCLLLTSATSCGSGDWRTASRESTGIAPKASQLKEAIFQIYYARAYSWRGWFGVHPWVAWKLKGESQYTVAQIHGWNAWRGKSTVMVFEDLPDRKWFGSDPTLSLQVRGAKAEVIVSRVKELIKKYPYRDSYRVWPGPNSNTFVSYLIRHTPQLVTELPPHAVGKDWLVDSQLFSKIHSGTGLQFSLLGVLGLTIGLEEGIEVNILGLSFGLDFNRPALKLPMIGRLGFQDQQVE